MSKEKTFTYGEILDILQGIIDAEQENCRQFYKEHPDAGGGRRRDSSLIAQGIMLAMFAFDEQVELQREGD